MRVRGWLIAGLLVVAAAVWLLRTRADEAARTVDDDGSAAAVADGSSARTRRTAEPALRSRTPGAPLASSSANDGAGEQRRSATAAMFDPARRHTADPCTRLLEPVVPVGFEQITEAGITIAWDPADLVGPYDVPLRPVALAHAVGGILEEAASLTGTERRPQLTIIVDGSPEDLQARTRVPKWVGGLYDGAAVHVPAKANADLGVAIATLRHELMHAQIHAGIGCVPFWFHEGLATYFAGRTPTHEWIAMLRDGAGIDLDTVRDPSLFDHDMGSAAARLYAVSLAMVVYIVHERGEGGLREAVRAAQRSHTPLELWTMLYPQATSATVVDALAQKVFGVARGADLDAVLRGPVCCRNLRQPAELACRAQTSEATTRREVCSRW